MKTGYKPTIYATQAEVDAGSVDNSHGVDIVIVDSNEQPTGIVYQGGATPQQIATSATIAAITASIAIIDWTPNDSVTPDMPRRATATAGLFDTGDLIRSTATRTTRANFDVIETGFWTGLSLDKVESVAGRTGAIILTEADVTNLTTDLAAKALDIDLATHTGDVSNPHTVTKTQVGLGSVDNTADTAKPVSIAQQTALNLKESTASKNVNSGYAGLDATGKVPLARMNVDTTKQDILTSGTNIKTVNGVSVLGAGDLPIAATSAQTTPFSATGGIITTVGSYTVHTFTSNGTFTPSGAVSVAVLVVGGGAGGDIGVSGGVSGHGGGGGFVTYDSALAVSSNMGVIIGGGGAAATNGTLSAFGSTIASGGIKANNIATGGSGGDSGKDINGGITSYAGGADGTTGGAGGAGAGGASATANNTTGSAGGIGYSSGINGTTTAYAGGGGGSTTTGSSSGTDGGGSGATSGGTAGNGTVNTGGGGGGVYLGTAGIGGSGIVIVRYLTNSIILNTPIFASNALAIAGGKAVGDFYRSGADPSVVCVVF